MQDWLRAGAVSNDKVKLIEIKIFYLIPFTAKQAV